MTWGCGGLGQVPALGSAREQDGRLTKLEVGVVGADMIASTEQPLHHQGGAHGVEQAEVFGDPAFLLGRKRREGREEVRREGGKEEIPKWEIVRGGWDVGRVGMWVGRGKTGNGGRGGARPGMMGWGGASLLEGPADANGRAPHQGVEVVAQQSPVVVDLPLQDDEQEEQPQQDVPQVAQDVVEGASRGVRGRLSLMPQPLPHTRSHSRSPCPLLGLPFSLGKGPPQAAPPEVAQRVGAEEVVVADVLIPCDIHHLQQGVEAGGGC